MSEQMKEINTKKVSMKKRKKKKSSMLPLILIFLIGLGILAYPKISDLYYKVETTKQTATFNTEKKKLATEDIKKKMALAQAYNDHLINKITNDPYSKQKQNEAVAEYAKMLEVKEMIGQIQIPSLDLDIPIYAGTSNQVLEKGVGHLEGTSLPIGGNSTHSVLAAHSGLPKQELFTNLTNLKVGDKFFVTNIKEKMAYQIDDIRVVLPSDFSRLTVVPGHDYITLLTCTPVPVNDHRLLIRGHRVQYVPAVDEETILESKYNFTYKYLFYAALALIALMLLILIYLRIKYVKNRETLNKIKEEIKLKEQQINKDSVEENVEENVQVSNKETIKETDNVNKEE